MKTIKFSDWSETPAVYTGAAEYNDGSKAWYKEGKPHSLDGPSYIGSSGYKEWMVEGKLHRVGGPAVEGVNGEKQWYKEGLWHRLDGPAIEGADGQKQWWVRGIRVPESAFPEAVRLYKCSLVLT
jgi:hypothetical protein